MDEDQIVGGQITETLEQAVFVAMGAVSGCWANLASAGEFESDRAKAHCEELIRWIKAHYEPKEGTIVG